MAAIISTMFHNHLYGCHVHVQAWVFEWLIDYQYTIEWHIDADELFVGYGSSVMYICGGQNITQGMRLKLMNLELPQIMECVHDQYTLIVLPEANL